VTLVLPSSVLGRSVLSQVASAMYRSGALVFGGGHVVLPLLQSQTVPSLVTRADFLSGYGVVQAVPGPLFTFSTYLGEIAGGPSAAIVATVAIFLPGALVLFGVLSIWHRVQGLARLQTALAAVNAAVVGLLAAALVRPLATSAIASPLDVAFAALLFALLRWARAAPWIVVLVALAASPIFLLTR
jgi:chromate transporter